MGRNLIAWRKMMSCFCSPWLHSLWKTKTTEKLLSPFLWFFDLYLYLSIFQITNNQAECISLLDVLGHSLGSFGNSVSGEFSWQDELDGWLNFSWRKGPPLVEPDELGAFGGDSVEGVVDEGVHDVHGLFGDTDVGVDLLEDFVDVDGEGFDSPSSGLLVGFRLGFLLSH